MAVLTLANEFITHLHNHIRMYQTHQTFSGAVLRSRPLSLYQQWEETDAPVTVRDNPTLNAAIYRAQTTGSSPTRTKTLSVEDVPHVRRIVAYDTVVESEGAHWQPCQDARIVMILEVVLRAMPPRRLDAAQRLETPREFITRIARQLRPHTVDGMPDIGSKGIPADADDDGDAGAARSGDTTMPVLNLAPSATVVAAAAEAGADSGVAARAA